MDDLRVERIGAAASLGACTALLLLTACLAGCQGGYQNGVLQVAYYTDPQTGYYPRAGCGDDLFFLFKGDESLYVDWQDLRVLRISVPKVDKDWYDMSWWQDPLGLRKGDRFHVRVESVLPEYRQAKTLRVRESHPGKVTLPGVATVRVVIDETQYGKARLDRLAIDFERAFLKELRRRAQPPFERVGSGEWRFMRRTPLTQRTTIVRAGRRRDYQYECDTNLDHPAAGRRPTIEFTVRGKEVRQKLIETTYMREWEYWPTNPTGPGAVPLRMRPLRIVRIPGVQKEVERQPQEGQEGPAAKETLIVRFAIANPPPGWTPPEFLHPRTLVTDDDGKATLDLWPLRKLLTILPSNKIIIHFKCADDPAKTGGTVEIDRSKMVGWARVG